MARCTTCQYPLPDDRERVGARCPQCREPIYEPTGRVPRPAREGEASCPLHAGMESVGVCLRCGGYVCETCRTRWRGQILCPTCVGRALETSEATPGQEREQRRQARASVICGAAAWVGGGIALAALATSGGPVVTFAALVTLAANVLVASAGAGAGVAALRGERRFRGVALAGLVVSGLYAGVALGAAALALWQN